jgi:hypothetical protein
MGLLILLCWEMLAQALREPNKGHQHLFVPLRQNQIQYNYDLVNNIPLH